MGGEEGRGSVIVEQSRCPLINRLAGSAQQAVRAASIFDSGSSINSARPAEGSSRSTGSTGASGVTGDTGDRGDSVCSPGRAKVEKERSA